MLRKWSKGQALAEFAIILPTVLVTMFLIVETGRIFQAYVTVQNAARDGARYAVTGRGGSLRVDNIKIAAKELLAAGLPLLDDPSCSDYCCDLGYEPENYCVVVWSKGGYDAAGLPGERVQVQVTYNVRIITPLLSMIAPYVPVTGRVEMVNEPFGPTGQAHAGIVPPTLGIPPTFTPTHTPTPTATPIPLTINEPLRPGEIVVTGNADTRFGEMLIVIRDQSTGQTIGTGNLRPDGTFRIGVSPGLVGGHTIRAVSEYGYDEAVVGAATATFTSTATATSTSTATSTPVLSPTSTATSTPTPTNTPTPYNQRVNAGGANYTDGSGNLWSADQTYTPGSWGHAGLVDLEPNGSCGSVMEAGLFNSYTHGEFMTYVFDNVTNAQYEITLLFVEPEALGPYERVFDVAIEGKMVLDDLDLYAEVGRCAPYSASFSVGVKDNQLEIDFAPGMGEVIVSGISVGFTDYFPTATPTSTPTFTPGPTDTPTATPILPPDLTITALSLLGSQPITTCWTPLYIESEVTNLSTGPCNQFFWTDLYVYTDTQSPEVNTTGLDWQGINSLGPNSSKVITFTHSFSITGTHYLYTLADSFEFVSEMTETNNVGGPVTVEVQCEGEPPTPTPVPTPHPACGDLSGTVWAFIGGQLVVPSERVQVELYQGVGGLPIASVLTNEQGQYLFDCVPPGDDYMVVGTVDLDSVPYFGSEGGISMPENGQISNVDIILYPAF